MTYLDAAQFLGDPFEVARKNILGAILATDIGGKRTSGMITEVEVYIGGSDKASHTYGYRKTPRVMSQYERGGRAYVFLVYGIHAQFNVVLGEAGVPDVVLVRSISPVEGADIMLKRRGLARLCPRLCSGPGNVTKALGITTDMNGYDLMGGSEIKLFSNRCDDEIIEARRIGIDYAEEYAYKPWRYYYKNNEYVSKRGN